MNWVDKVRKLNKEYIVCVGIDPMMNNIQKLGLNLSDWVKIIIDSTAEYTDTYKFQLAYFEENGIEGLNILKTSVEYLKSSYPKKIIIGDSKRSDIGSTAAAYSKAMYDYWSFDVSTVNPYFGSDSIIPFAEKNGALIICKSSNNSSNEIQHPAVREIFKYMDVKEGLEIHYDADLPARSGLGSSSSFTVGLLHTLYALNGVDKTANQLAKEAIEVEQNIIKENVGSQDQIAAAYGGLNKIDF